MYKVTKKNLRRANLAGAAAAAVVVAERDAWALLATESDVAPSVGRDVSEVVARTPYLAWLLPSAGPPEMADAKLRPLLTSDLNRLA